MADTEKDVQGVAELLAKTTVDQVNIVSFKAKGLKLNSSEDGEIFLAVNLLKKNNGKRGNFVYTWKKTCLTLRIVFLHLSAVEVVDAIKASKDIQALCLEGNTIGVEAAKAIGEALSTRQEFEVKSKDC